MEKPVIIVGGGLAGLACAVKLHQEGVPFLLLESSDAPGGRVRTDSVEGFQLDRGFQVFLSAYPEAGRVLDLEALRLRRFQPGALVLKDGRMRRLMDVIRRPRFALQSALQPVGTLRDKLLVGLLQLAARRHPIADIAAHEDLTTEAFLRRFGFSEMMIDNFFRAFYGGIFLERELRTSSRMFEFLFKMFAEGYATLPANGMQEIPRQLAAGLPQSFIRLNAPVKSVGLREVVLASGESLAADRVVVATDADTARQLVPEFASMFPGQARWNSTTTLYFSAPRSPLGEAIIALNGDGTGLVNSVCAPSDVAVEYAPAGRALLCVSLLGIPGGDDLEHRVITELAGWFGDAVRDWTHLRTYRIERALPGQPPSNLRQPHQGFRTTGRHFVCGDHCSSASIEGALTSGRQAAEALLAGS